MLRPLLTRTRTRARNWTAALGAGAMLVAALPMLLAAPAPGRAPAASASSLPGKTGSKPEAAEAAPASPEALEFFEKNVRPVLVEQCSACHSSGSKAPMGGMRLDSREALLKGGARGPALVPGDPERSLLIHAVSYTDPALQMPPRGKLKEPAIAALTQWIKMGAPFGRMKAGAESGTLKPSAFDFKARARHWAFQPVKRPPLPPVKRADWLKTPVDSFILARLEAAGLAPAPPADRRTLIRRVTYDLIGLPPTLEEVNAFLNDRSPDAYRKVVERLLASPHYGERWARHWLDLVRFAETDGHEFDFDKVNAWQYRDYVVRAFNSDLPYDRFVTEHLAGDLLPRPRFHPTEGFNESIIGTGFFWLGEGKHSPVDLREDQAERVDNQIDVFSKTFLGLTVGCARCHDHKFDAISTKDYYGLYGYLQSSRYQSAAINAPGPLLNTVRELEKIDARLQPALAGLAFRETARLAGPWEHSPTPGPPACAPPGKSGAEGGAGDRLLKYLAETAAKDPSDPLHPWAVLAGSLAASAPGGFAREKAGLLQRLRAQAARAEEETRKTVIFEDFSGESYGDWFVTGEAFGSGPARAATAKLDAGSGRLAGVASPGWADSGRVSERLQGTLRSQDFALQKPWIWYRMAGRGATVNLIVDGFQRIRYPIYGGLTLPVNDDRPRWHAMDVGQWAGHRAYVEIIDPGPGFVAVDRVLFADAPPPPAAPNALVLQLLEDETVTSPETLVRAYGAALQETSRLWASGKLDGSPDSSDRLAFLDCLLRAGAFPAAPEPALAALLEQRRKLEAGIPAPSWVMAIADGSPEDERVHLRGSSKSLGDVVPRRLLEAVAGKEQPAPAKGSGRLELAERMTAPSNPLLARVMVNRIWQHHFGEGLVRTPDDFGIRGERPTHPELLDFLAHYFATGDEGRETDGPGLPSFVSGPPRAWSIKAMHRMMVLSSAYQMSSRPVPAAEAKDPQNRLLHRMPVRRLEAEAIRDAVLAVSGRLDRKLYGPPVLPYLTPFMEGRGRPASSGPLDGAGRRSLYISVRRNFLTPMFLAFDYPIPFSTIGRRSVSTVPAQALILMNNPFVVQQAEVWAKRVLAEPGLGEGGRISRMYLAAFARLPSDKELAAAAAFLSEQDRSYGGNDDPRSWRDLGHVLMNTKEFIYVP